MTKLLFFILLTACANAQTVGAVELHGRFTQGGLATGVVSPGSRVLFGGQAVPVGADGRFFIGFDRLAPVEIPLEVIQGKVRQTQQVIIEPRSYATQAVTGVPAQTVNPDPAQVKRIDAEAARIKKARQTLSNFAYLAGLTLGNPVPGARISGVYGSRRVYNGEERSWHKGLDFAAPTGTPVKAPAAALVRLVMHDSFMNGNTLLLDHGQGVTTIYAHLNKIYVKENDKIEAGQVIGAVGSTGRSSGPHLHMGLSWHNIALDPQLFVEE